ncbi:zinc ABC transporter substrate-binding protein AdcA [Streptococcus sp. DD13]|uniref:zinc ABC transporter substrate-binding protein AdcA n=1 Tax=Streptococcus sp. DD13 TaxID=1777881 RepID=UPI0007944BFB|nr:zinc ABC transporter substrate-binding protein AdcA [Streptococcus sp. DD13]KXT77628.1 putative zinc-binding lipoprotein ZinT [Streptococcus sp. DD13]
MKKLVVLCLALFSSLLVACKSQQNGDKLQIVTTFYPVYEFTKQIVGDEADVQLLVAAGTEVHDYEPSAKAVANIQDADVFVYENENMETWVPNTLKNVNTNKVHVVKATENMVLLPGSEEEDHDHEGGEDHHHAYDPHVWLSPQRAKVMLANIRDSLVAQYPDKKEKFEKQASDYMAKLDELDKSYQNAFANAKQKNFITQHAAFRYLALDYGLNQISISGLSPDKEPSASRLAELTKYIKDNQIKYIYFEENASPAVASTLSKETGVTLDVLNPIESLTEEQTKAGEDYLSIMKSNLVALEKTTSQAGGDVKQEVEENTQTVANGYFKDEDVKDRSLSDYEGKWQSVYPLLENGTLDQVFDYKAKLKKDKTAAEYKAYYQKGYQTAISEIDIKGDAMTFIVNGEKKTYHYKYAGKHTLTYKKGNRGVRYLFEATEADAGEYKYIQFSDHQIAPSKAAHFHIFMGGESQDALYQQLENWPTYYPSGMTGFEIAQEMMAH